MHFIAFTFREWKPNSLGQYDTNSSASEMCFVTTMFAHVFIRLIIQNRFHLLFSIWNSLSGVLSALLFVAAVSIHLCYLRRWISSQCSSLRRIFQCLPLRGLTIWRSCVCCSVCMRNSLRFTDSKHCFAEMMKRQLVMSVLVIDGNLKSLSVECCLKTKMRRDVNYCMTSWRTPSDIFK